MQGLRTEVTAFLTAFLTGMIVVCAYVCIRKFRRVIRHTLTMVAVEDGLSWTGTAVYIFTQIYSTSSGSIRWYFVIGAGLGTAVFLLFGRVFGNVWSKCIKKRSEKSRKNY